MEAEDLHSSPWLILAEYSHSARLRQLFQSWSGCLVKLKATGDGPSMRWLTQVVAQRVHWRTSQT